MLCSNYVLLPSIITAFKISPNANALNVSDSLIALSLLHLFCHCLFTKNLYLEIKQWLAMCNVNLPNRDDIIILYGISPSTKHNTLLNHIIMLFKHFVYNCRSYIKSLNRHNFLLKVQENEKVEFKIAKKRNKLFLHELKSGKISLHLKSI